MSDLIMSQFSRTSFLLVLVVAAFGLDGCGTIRTMPTLASYGAPKIYSGTRLDFHAIRGNESRLREFSASPPNYPIIDIPFSLIADTVILPATIPVVSYELVFGK